MLPEFTIPATLADGEEVAFVAWDIPAWLFFAGMPDVPPGTPCWGLAESDERTRLADGWRAWEAALITRAILVPRLTLETGERLGDERGQILLTYMRTVGWITDGNQDVRAVEAATGYRAQRRAMRAEFIAERVALPGPNTRKIIQQLCIKARLDAWRLQNRPISEWAVLYRLHLEEDLKRRAVRVPDIYDRIGTVP